jgi:hypothetical protein
MYATRQSAAARARRLEPIGATVLLPLTKEAFQKLHDGVIGDAELTPSDLAPTSSYIFPQLVTDIGAGNDLTASEISESQIHNIMYQAAYFTRGLRPARPTVLAFAATPQLHERLRRHGYHDVGRCLRGTDNPLLCLRPPEKQRGNNWKDHVCYDMFLLAIKPYSLSNAAEWKEEDRLKG